MPRAVAAMLCLVLLTGCGQRGQLTMFPAAAEVGRDETIFVASSRAIDPETGTYGTKRSETISFSRFDISVPPDRAPGVIKWPKKGAVPDPATDFLTTSSTRFDSSSAFRRNLASSLRNTPGRGRSATIFVHGFNNTFAEGLYRIAQLSHDLDLEGQVLHYSWASAAQPLGYVYDRDSALIARDGFEKLLDEVIAAGANDILLTCHSMGCLLMMEAMRQIDIREPGTVARRVRAVVMLSPDIDVEVFRSAARGLKSLPDPFFIFSSQKDKALRLSSLLTGQPDRLGNLTNLNEVADLPVTVLDTTQFSTGSGHMNVGDSPALIALLGNIERAQAAFDLDAAGRPGLLPGIVLTARQATGIVLSPVVAIDNELNGR